MGEGVGAGVGEGVAIPHGKIQTFDKSYGFFASIERPIDFEMHTGVHEPDTMAVKPKRICDRSTNVQQLIAMFRTISK